MTDIDMVEAQALADGDPQVAGWIVGQILAGHDMGEIRATLGTARINLETRRQRAEAGDSAAILQALGICLGLWNFPLPAWLQQRIGAAIAARLEWTSTLDDALALPAFKHKAAIEKERDFNRWMSYVWQQVGERSVTREPISMKMFEAIAADICAAEKALTGTRPRIGATKVGEMYTRALAIFGAHQ